MTLLHPIPAIAPWAVMWALAFAAFFACKAVTWARDVVPAGHATLPGAARWFLAWPGMEPAFLHGQPRAFPDRRRWVMALLRLGAGAALVWAVVPTLLCDIPVVAGWVGMIGLVLMLHFGAFDLLALAWQMRGADARPLMNAPTRAKSLADFWGNRWNTAFHHLAARYVFNPLRRPLGVPWATLATFLASGLVHDLVISVPAGAGYGLPTLYFVIQGIGVVAERSKPARRFGLARGLPGRLFAALFVLAPLPWLFHEPFVVRVILPFLEVIR